jgi:hypothetical protein
MPLDVGILIIGSLFWDYRRDAWRNARLNMNSTQPVTAPIRYGRLSTTRGNTYTMVFSRRCKAGQGIVLRCLRGVSTPGDLFAEAEALWKAEQPSAAAHQIASDWGCVALLSNPERRMPPEIVKAWSERVKKGPGYGRVIQAIEEGALITAAGMLEVPWPHNVSTGEPLQMDALLVTANVPTLADTPDGYPTAEMIASAWNKAGGKLSEYFWSNTENEIRTFQDDEIRAALRPRGPKGAV